MCTIYLIFLQTSYLWLILFSKLVGLIELATRTLALNGNCGVATLPINADPNLSCAVTQDRNDAAFKLTSRLAFHGDCLSGCALSDLLIQTGASDAFEI